MKTDSFTKDFDTVGRFGIFFGTALSFALVRGVDYWLSFITGLFGSVHCVGMCGVIILAYSTQTHSTASLFPGSSHLVYNAGRLLGYMLIGGILGAIGGGLAGLQIVGRWFTLVAGVALVTAGLSGMYVLRFHGPATIDGNNPSKESVIGRIYRHLFRGLVGSFTLESKFYLGLLTSLLPCGLLYPMFLKAASTASMMEGSLTMLAFGLGMVPALVLTGLASSYFGFKLKKISNLLAASTIVLMGLMLVIRGMGIHAAHPHHLIP